ncbi:MAG: hypothetical protein PHU51_06000 [Candidatus Nanoarchaeia archaeon]|jgi:hypothetical protein|nr:hypothetical protein [Candidatus Nanoarchaeia archaeon]
MKKYQVTLTGESPIIMHADNIAGSETVRAWQKNPNNKSKSVAGDDRSPAWTWLTYCYHNGKNLVIDVDCIMSMLRDAGKKCAAPTGRGSLKSQTQSGIIAEGLGWDLLANGNPIPWEPLAALYSEEDFEVHQQVAESLGVELFLKRARIGMAKHVRVRPRISNWTANGVITVLDEQLTQDVITTILKQGGFYVGLCDWRPGSGSPGQFGRFSVNVKKL